MSSKGLPLTLPIDDDLAAHIKRMCEAQEINPYCKIKARLKYDVYMPLDGGVDEYGNETRRYAGESGKCSCSLGTACLDYHPGKASEGRKARLSTHIVMKMRANRPKDTRPSVVRRKKR